MANNKISKIQNDHLKAIKSSTVVINAANKVLELLTDKRSTVAEKAIQVYLDRCIKLENELISYLCNASNGNLSSEYCQKLRLINIRLSKQLKSFLKAAEYNLNYLEQYFEHDFWLELVNQKFTERLNDILQNTAKIKY